MRLERKRGARQHGLAGGGRGGTAGLGLHFEYELTREGERSRAHRFRAASGTGLVGLGASAGPRATTGAVAAPEYPPFRRAGVLSRPGWERAAAWHPMIGRRPLKPAVEIAYRRYVESLADFAEAHEALASMLAEDRE